MNNNINKTLIKIGSTLGKAALSGAAIYVASETPKLLDKAKNFTTNQFSKIKFKKQHKDDPKFEYFDKKRKNNKPLSM